MTSARTVHRSRSGFTLVELLTVVAIIGVLAAIIAPAVGRVRANAGSSRCSAGLRQVGAAVMLFAGEHRGRAPVADGALSDGEGHWHVQIAPYLSVIFADGATADQKRTTRIGNPVGCPLAPKFDSGNDVQAIGASYGWNAAPIVYGMALLQGGVSLGVVPNPGRTIMVGERWGQNAAGNRDTNWAVNPPFMTTPVRSDDAGAAGNVSALRISHGDRANFLFFDGHVAALTTGETCDSSNLTTGNLWRGL